jgi:undecaprenyl phosphate N,N'-diacetylbacillosamine 1-phosphate transferase
MQQFIKRVLDLLVSLTALILLSPLLIAIAIIIKLSSKGPAIFRQERAGKNGKPFILYKFRTMKSDVNPFGQSPKSGDDPRLIKFGKFIREYSLDELPQFFNVLKGDMTIVGPRPLYISQMAEWDQNQKRRLLVKPGLTGLAQISGRGALTREEKLELDIRYVDSANLWLDFKIVFVTIAHVFTKTSIYEKRYSRTEETRGDKS